MHRISRGRVKKNDSQYYGKYLISTSDLGISAEDAVLGYKEPAERIKAHVPLLLTGYALNQTR